jgi:hypothetical protein
MIISSKNRCDMIVPRLLTYTTFFLRTSSRTQNIRQIFFDLHSTVVMASTIPDRSTKINMDLVPTFEAVQKSSTPKRSLRTHEVGPSSKRKRVFLPEAYRSTTLPQGTGPASSSIRIKPAPNSQALIPAGEVAVSTHDILWESPWEYYQQAYELNIGGFVFVASEQAPPHDLFIIRQLLGNVEKVHILQAVRHRNFQQMLECFNFEGSYFAVFSYDPISLAHIAKSPPFLTELQLAAIVGQVSILSGFAISWLTDKDP